jgi:hypothetical protein
MVLLRAVALLVLLMAPVCAAPEAPASEAQCPRGCSGNGECINGVCLCMSTHTGADCATEVSPDASNAPACEEGSHHQQERRHLLQVSEP